MSNKNRTPALAGQRLPFLNPQAAAIATKLVEARTMSLGGVNGTQGRQPNSQILQNQSKRLSSDITTAQNLREMLPDIEMASQLLVSSILSPQDMVSRDIYFKLGFDDFPAQLVSRVSKHLSDFFTDVYPVRSFISKAIEDALFNTGSYPLLVIPETGLDSVINYGGKMSLEEIVGDYESESGTAPSIGLLGPSDFQLDTKDGKSKLVERKDLSNRKFSIEQLSGEAPLMTPEEAKSPWLSLSFTDNVNVLKYPAALEEGQSRMRKRAMDRAYKRRSTVSWNTEGLELDEKQMAEIRGEMARDRPAPGYTVQLHPMDRYSRKPIGHPLVMRLPPECVVNIHPAGKPECPIYHLVLLDEYGAPLHRAKGSDYYRQLEYTQTQAPGQDLNNTLADIANRGVYGNRQRTSSTELMELRATAQSVVQQDILSRLKNGRVNANLELAANNNAYDIILARHLANKGTQMLMVPVELMTYFAYEYNEDGTGRSLLDKTKILATQRATLQFANIMRSVRSAVGATQINVALDPDDANPDQTMQIIRHELARTRSQSMPLSVDNAYDLVSYLQNAGVSIVATGNPNYPETSVTQEERTIPNIQPFEELEERKKREHFLGFGLPPELVDSLGNVEFAQSITSSNLLFAKRILAYQEPTTDLINDHMQKYVWNSGQLLQELQDIVVEELKEMTKKELVKLMDYLDIEQRANEEKRAKSELLIESCIDELVKRFSISLPAPDTKKFEQQKTALNEYIEGLDVGLRQWLSPEMISGLIDSRESSAMEAFLQQIKSYFVRKFMVANSILPELSELMGDEDTASGGMIADVKDLLEATQKTLQGLVKECAKRGIKFEAAMDELGQGENTDGEGKETGTGTEDEAGGFDNLDADQNADDANPEGEDEVKTDDAEPADKDGEAEPAEPEVPEVPDEPKDE